MEIKRNIQNNSLLSSKVKTALILSTILGLTIAIFPQFAKQMPRLKWIQAQKVKTITLFLGGTLATANLSFLLSSLFFQNRDEFKSNKELTKKIKRQNDEIKRLKYNQDQAIEYLNKKYPL